MVKPDVLPLIFLLLGLHVIVDLAEHLVTALASNICRRGPRRLVFYDLLRWMREEARGEDLFIVVLLAEVRLEQLLL